jgi:phospholipid/cholesterol/gamma-HCH transport system permease protein
MPKLPLQAKRAKASLPAIFQRESMNQQTQARKSAESALCTIRAAGGATVVEAGGNWVAAVIAPADRALRELAGRASAAPLVIDLSRVGKMDTAGAWIVSRLAKAWREAGGTARIVSAPQSVSERLLEAVSRDMDAPASEREPNALVAFLENLGRFTKSLQSDTVLSLNMIGAAIRGPQLKAGRKGSVRPVSIIYHIDRMGIRAVPIIALMSFLIGAIIAQQGAWSLRYFGAEFLTVDFVGILLLREVGVLLTAIMVAGRSGSAMTAEIGSMKMREEVDALTVIGLNPVGVLVFPRLVALTIALPMLTFIANIASLAGAALLLNLYSDIPFDVFLTKLRTAVDLSTLMAGMIKAPFMALIIGIMAAVEGMKVEGSAESLGRRVTAAVVKAIFFVIVVDGFFAVFYAQINY